MTNEEVRDAPVPDWHIKTAIIYNENGEKHLYNLCRAIHTPAESYEEIVKSNALFWERRNYEKVQA